MDVNDWTPAGKDSFTTPGGVFAPPPAGAARTYEFESASARRSDAFPRPEASEDPAGPAATPETSPFARGAASAKPWYAAVQAETQGVPAGDAAQSAPRVFVSQNGTTQTAVPVQATPGAPVYTIQLPAPPRQPAPKQRSLWWVPLLVIAALLLGMVIGYLLYPLLPGNAGPTLPQAASGNDSETTAARVYRENVDAVVSIAVGPSDAGSPGTTSSATGFLITSDGYLLTNAHAVRNGGSVTVTLSDGRQLTARVLAAEEVQSDLALLKIEATGLRFVTLGDSDTLQVGDPVFTIGNPLGDLSNSLSAGYLSAAARQINTGSTTLTMLQTNAAINKGNSGGPLFDAAGRVVGVVTAKISASGGDNTVEGLGFALPINDVMEIVTPWLEAAKRAE